MTSKQKAKGYKYEKKTEEILNEISGVIARRNIMSGSLKNYSEELDGDIKAYIGVSCFWCAHCIPNAGMESSYCKLKKERWCFDEGGPLCDAFIPNLTEMQHFTRLLTPYKIEVKARSKDFPKWIEDSLTQGDLTVIWKLSGSGTKAEPFVLMRLETFKELIE